MKRPGKNLTAAARSAEVQVLPQPRRGQLIASSVLLGLWMLFLLAVALTA